MSEQADIFAAVLDAMCVRNVLALKVYRGDPVIYAEDPGKTWHARLSIDEGTTVLYVAGEGETPHDAVLSLWKELEGRK